MGAKIIDGKVIAAQMRAEMKQIVDAYRKEGIVPTLAVILVGDDSASQVYVRNKEKACHEIGIRSMVYRLRSDADEEELLGLVEELNEEDSVHGILVQLPLPKHINAQHILRAIDPKKDVDCFHPFNAGKMLEGSDGFLPCTPAGIIEMLHRSGIEIAGKHCVVLGRSNIVGKPMAILMLRENATVTICHSVTKDLKEWTRQADILISAVGKAKMVTIDMVKPGAVVIDVGMNRDAMGKLCGDVDYDAVSGIAGAITPVPGGVGPMTITMLLQNCLKAVELAKK